MLKKVFGPKRDSVAGGRRRWYNEELDCVYSAPNTIRVIN